MISPLAIPASKTAKSDKDKAEGKNIQALSEMAGSLKKEVVDPLRSTLTLSGGQSDSLKGASGTLQTRGQIEKAATETLSPSLKGVTRGLGMTGGALGGVSGLNQVVQGFRDGDAPKAFSGATDVAVSASAMATLGMIGGAAVFGPASVVFIGMRGLHKSQINDRGSHLSATTDLLTAATFCTRLLPTPAAVPFAFGVAATGLGFLKGLNSLKKGVETDDARQRIQGTGEALTALGVALVGSGLAVGPGVAVILGGLALPLLQRISTARPVVNAMVDWTAMKLYPLAVKTERALDHLSPVLTPIAKLAKRGRAFAAPFTEPLTKPLVSLGKKAFLLGQKGARWASDTWVVNALEVQVGRLNKHLLPAPVNPSDVGGAASNVA